MADRNIILVGFMGTGKTSVAETLASRTGMSLLDMDTVIAERAGKSIPRIFAEDGEPAFREREHALAAELAQPAGLIVSTGGGIVTNPDNIHLLSQGGLVACLQATVDEILRRVGHDTGRPLLQTDDKRGKILALLQQRAHLYAAIPVQIDTNGQSIEQVAQQVLAAYHRS